MNVILVGIYLVTLCQNGFAMSLTQPEGQPPAVVQFNKMHAAARLRYMASQSKSHWSTEDELANKLNELERYFGGENGVQATTNDLHEAAWWDSHRKRCRLDPALITNVAGWMASTTSTCASYDC